MTVTAAFRNFTIVAILLGAAGACVISFVAVGPVRIFLIALLISYIFISSNFLVIKKINTAKNKTFFIWFALSFAVRFFGALAAVIIGIKMLNLYEILFTVSFLFSYLCLSITEIIYLNRILKNDT